jgi:endonuclease YncB( thermonuclease family)
MVVVNGLDYQLPKSIARQLIEAGLAVPYNGGLRPPSDAVGQSPRNATLATLEEAMETGRGLWAEPEPVARWEMESAWATTIDALNHKS